MKHFIIALLLLITLKLSARQSEQKMTIKGVMIDSATRNPLSYATLVLRDAVTAAPVKSLLTKDDGSFEFVVSANKAYLLAAAYVGYKGKIIKVPGNTALVNLQKISLSPAQGQLREVSITATKPLLS